MPERLTDITDAGRSSAVLYTFSTTGEERAEFEKMIDVVKKL